MKFLKQSPFIFLVLLVILITFNSRFIGPAIIFWVLTSLIFGNYKDYKSNFNKNKGYYFPLIAFYIWHVVGMLWSSNLSFGGKDLEYKLSFIIIPFVFPLVQYSKVQINKIFSFFILLNFFVAVICVTNSVISYLNGDGLILASQHVLFIHRSYYSFYLIFSLTYLLSSKVKFDFGWMNTSFFKILSALIMFSSIVMGQSKAGIISMFILIGFIFLDYRKIITKKIIIGFGIISILFFIVFGNTLVSRFRPMINSLTSDKEINVNKPGSTGARIQLSESAWQLIDDSPWFGYGTGDIKDELKRQNEKNGFIGAVKRNYNAHNQFLNTWVALGVVGLLLLLSIFVFPFIDAYKHKNLFSIAFLVILFFNCIPEAWMEQQAGIVSSVLFICLLPYTNK